jgi:uncharacterized protein (DUF2252 family)
MNIRQSTTSYEKWMRQCIPLVEADLRFKHREMREEAFLFFRATYYLWAQRWEQVDRDLRQAPKVLAVADLHVGSFGTWRDAEGRLCWGVDDFDECWPLAYTNDLVRLAASAKIVCDSEQLCLTLKHACDAILHGYATTLRNGGDPFVLAEEEQHLEKLGIKAFKPPDDFWGKMTQLPVSPRPLPADAVAALRKTLPKPDLKCKIVRRRAGTGSLGQDRFAAMVRWEGGWIARELKQLVPSSNLWLEGRTGHTQSHYNEAISAAVRSRDPFQTISGKWLTRRLSPDSNPIDIADLPREIDEERLMSAMGAEAANVHLGRARQADRILKDLRARKSGWLQHAARDMAKAMVADWKEFKGD